MTQHSRRENHLSFRPIHRSNPGRYEGRRTSGQNPPSMGRLGWVLLSVALLVVLTLLATRPHVGTVYVEERIRAYNGELDTTIHDWPTVRECEDMALLANNAAWGMHVILHKSHPRVVAFYCKPSTRLLWGW